MSAGILTAGGGHGWEPDVVSELSRPGSPLTVVRRCADVADVLAVASTGQIAVAVIAADLRRLDSETVHQLAGFDVDVVAVHRAGDEHMRAVLQRIGVAETVADGGGTAAILAAVERVQARRQGARDDGESEPGAVGLGAVAEIGWPAAGESQGEDGAGADPIAAHKPGTPGRGQRVAGGSGGDATGDGVPGAPARFVPTSRWQPGADGPSGTVEAGHDAPRRARARSADAAPARHAGGRGRHGARRRTRAGDGNGRRGADGRTPGSAGVTTAPPHAVTITAEGTAPEPGRVIAVWGPGGAPGRSTVAMGLADRVVADGHSAMLIDADVYGGVLANAFGLLDESAGLAGACRLAAHGRLDPPDLASLCWQVQERLLLLSGIARADRWPELRPSAIPAVLRCAATLADVVIVDCAAVLELDEEITFDTLAPRRNGATVAVLQAADVVVAVGSGDPPGMERLARGYVDLVAVADEIDLRLVINRVRSGAASPPELREAAARFCGVEPVAYLPEDRDALDLAWRRGAGLSEVAAKSPLMQALGELSRTVLGAG